MAENLYPTNPKFTKPWHGIPRDQINWNPTIHEDVCIGCGTCVTGCSRLVYRYDFEKQIPVVAVPGNCMVGCTTCANTCPAHAISFPPLESVLQLEKKSDVHHNIEDDLFERREQLEIHQDLPHPDKQIQMLVSDIKSVGDRTKIITLTPTTKGDCLCVFIPGQYVEILIPGKSWLGRAYSIGNAPRHDGSIELQIRMATEGRMTDWIFNDLKLDDEVTVRGPLGNFTMRSAPETPLAFVAAGTAFAPIKALVEQQLALFPDRDMLLIWRCHSYAEFYELDLLEAWKKAGIQIELAMSGNIPDLKDDITLIQASLAEAIQKSHLNFENRDVYLAGSREAIIAARKALLERKVNPEKIFIDSFGG